MTSCSQRSLPEFRRQSVRRLSARLQGAKINHVVSRLGDVAIVFNHDDTMPAFDQSVQTLSVGEVQSCGWFFKEADLNQYGKLGLDELARYFAKHPE